MKRHITRIGIATALGLAVIALVALPGEARKKKNKKAWDPTDRPFNHVEHDKKVKAKGAETKCSTCHSVKSNGTLNNKYGLSSEHKRCASKCHSGSFRHKMPGRRELGNLSAIKSTYQSDRGRVCYVCHPIAQKIQPRNGLSDVNNQPSGTTSFVAVFSHKKHTATTAQSGRVCEKCHGQFGKGAPKKGNLLSAGHKLCADCHSKGLDPLMSFCGGCHFDKNSDRGKHPVTQGNRKNKYATTGAFDHDRHAQQSRVGTKGKECLTCHSNLKNAKDDSTVPMPTMQGCYKSCHDGKKAFSATGTNCTKCHQGGRR